MSSWGRITESKDTVFFLEINQELHFLAICEYLSKQLILKNSKHYVLNFHVSNVEIFPQIITPFKSHNKYVTIKQGIGK